MSSHFGVQQDDGTFQRSDRESILDRHVELAEEYFGADVDLSQGSPIKQIIDVATVEHDRIWQLMETVYYSAYFENAYGDQLDKLLAIASITRKARRGATGVVTFSTPVANEMDARIPAGTRVTTERTDSRPPIPFKTEEPAVLPAGAREVTDVPIRALEPWETDVDEEWLGEETNVAANTITEFGTPMPSVQSVTNPYPTGSASRESGYSFIEGRDRETDQELRDRFREQYGEAAHATLDAIRTNLLSETGVLNVGMEENVTMDNNTGSGGLPPKAFRATVLGDLPNDTVAQAIFDKRPVGIQSYGNASGTAYSDTEEAYAERWDWATEVTVTVEVDLTYDSNYPSDGNLVVENRIIRHIGGETAEGDQYAGLTMGQDVINDLIHSEVMDVGGVWQADIGVAESGNTATVGADLTIGDKETAMTNTAEVIVSSTMQERP